MGKPTSLSKITTHVDGLDNVLLGGFIRGGFYLVQGDPGSGKTTLALQFLSGRHRAGDRCLYVTLTESRADLESTCAAHGWSLDGLEILDLTAQSSGVRSDGASVFHPADTELSEIVERVLAEVERMDPQYVVFDGLSEMRLLSGEPLRYRRQLLSFKDHFFRRGTTLLVLDDRSSTFSDFKPESLVGGNVVLERFMPPYGRARRRLHVTKVRGAHFREGYHDYEIVTGGIVVHPRLVASDHRTRTASSRFESGIANLDQMLAGGLAGGSTTLLLGPAGTGKSTVAMQFVVNAIRHGKKAAVYVFDEVMHTLADRSEKLCLGKEGGFDALIEEGSLHAQQVDPAELSPGAFSHEVKRAVEAGAEIVVIDSLNGYINAMPDERFLATHLHELFAYLNQRGVLTIVVVAQHGMMAAGVPGDLDVSYLADSVILFRYYEARGEISQAINIFKKRTGAHERTIRALRITGKGIEVGDPLTQFRGIMTGVPQYEGASVATAGGERTSPPTRGAP